MADDMLREALQTLLCIRRLKGLAESQATHQSLPHLIQCEEAKALHSIRNALVDICAGNVRIQGCKGAVRLRSLSANLQSTGGIGQRSRARRKTNRNELYLVQNRCHLAAATASERIASRAGGAHTAAPLPVVLVNRKQKHRIQHRRACRAVSSASGSTVAPWAPPAAAAAAASAPTLQRRTSSAATAKPSPPPSDAAEDLTDILQELDGIALGAELPPGLPPAKVPRTLLL